MTDPEPYFGRGRVQSDPLKRINSSPARAPNWALCRVVTEQDAAFDERRAGVNVGTFGSVRFSITPMDADPTKDPEAAPGGVEDPDVEIRIWSAMANAFVPLSTPITASGAGAGVPYVVDVPDTNGAILGCFVTSVLTGVVAIAAQGFNENEDDV